MPNPMPPSAPLSFNPRTAAVDAAAGTSPPAGAPAPAPVAAEVPAAALLGPQWLTLLTRYLEWASAPGPGRERLAAWGRVRQSARRHYDSLIDAERHARDVSEAAPWKLLPHAEDSVTIANEAFLCPPAPAVRGDARTWLQSRGWTSAADWNELGRGLFDFTRRCHDRPAELWQAVEELLALRGARSLTCGMLSPMLAALRPQDFTVVHACVRTAINQITGSSFRASLRDYPAANGAARRLVAELAARLPELAPAGSALPPCPPEDFFEGWCHWLMTVHLMPEPEDTLAPVGNAAQRGEERVDAELEAETLSCALTAAPPVRPDDCADAPWDVPTSVVEVQPEFTADTAPAEDAAQNSVPDSARDSASSPLLAAALARLSAHGGVLLLGSCPEATARFARQLAAEWLAGSTGLCRHFVLHEGWHPADFLRGADDPRGAPEGRFAACCRLAATEAQPSVVVLHEVQRADPRGLLGELPVALSCRDAAFELASGGSLVVPAQLALIATAILDTPAVADQLASLRVHLPALNLDEDRSD